MWEQLVRSDAPAVAILIQIGVPRPELPGPFVGTFEIVCSALVLPGLVTRLAAIPLIMAIALTTTMM